jgi:putative DNA primase/helicase
MLDSPTAPRVAHVAAPNQCEAGQNIRASSSSELPPDRILNVTVLGEGRDELGKRYFKFRVEGRADDITIFHLDAILDRSFLKILGHAGARVFNTKGTNRLFEQLQEWAPAEPSFAVTTKLGWDPRSSKAYIQPKNTIGTPEVPIERYFRDLDDEMLAKYHRKGTLRQWQKQIAALCAGNSRLMFAVSLAFTGPILRFVDGSKAGGFQIFGLPESGKTTAAKVAGSVWGCYRSEDKRDRGFSETWNATKNKLEIIALAHNDALLILDETKHAGKIPKDRANVILEVTMRLAEQSERDRLTNAGSARGWRCYFLSTSNPSLTQIAHEGGISIDDAEIGRLTDIPLPAHGHGLFEELHGHRDGESLSNKLQFRSLKFFGSAGRAFVQHLVSDEDTAVKEFVRARRRAYLRSLARLTADQGLSPLKRPSDRFATVYAAGGLAIKYGIVGWDRKALLNAILSCQLDQLTFVEPHRGAAGSVQGARHRLIKYLRNNHKKFRRLKKGRLLEFGRDEINEFLGFRAKFKGAQRYYLSEEQLSAAVGKGGLVLELKRQLAEQRLLETDSQGRFVVQRVLFQGGRRKQIPTRVYSLKAEITADNTDAESKKKLLKGSKNKTVNE